MSVPFRTYAKRFGRGPIRVYNREGARVMDSDWDDMCPGCETSNAAEGVRHCPCCGGAAYADPCLLLDEHLGAWVGGGYTACNIPPSPDGPYIIYHHPGAELY